MGLKWTENDDLAVKTAKALAADAVEKAGSGHPGTAISLAPAAYLVFQRHLRFDPNDPQWMGRDRFVLSAGHASLLHYVQLYEAGLDVTLDDLKSFRTWGSKCPGHPEKGHTKGVEVTTGPLGTGLSAAVGIAMEQRRLRGLFDPEAPAGTSVFDFMVYTMAGDGCLQEGVASEACSLAGVQKLGNLVLIYDENKISIEDDTKIAFDEDVLERFKAYGWHTQRVSWLNEDGSYTEDLDSLNTAIENAKANTDQPSIISLRTIIGWPSPNKQNTGGIHGAKLGVEELAALKSALGLDPQACFAVDPQVIAYTQNNAKDRAQEIRTVWETKFETWKSSNPEKYALLNRLRSGELPENWQDSLPKFEEGKAIATRAASGEVLSALADTLPELWGGSADLAGSNNTTMKGQPSFLPKERSSKAFSGNQYGRTIHFGVREHGMGAILNGIAASGLTRPYGGTFFVFSDFMRGAVRLAALMNLPVTYVWTHDSIGVGEDGPTHQPVETLTACRVIPNLAVVRPADAAETAQAWRFILEKRGPAALVLSRQNLPNPARGEGKLACACNVGKGGYILKDCEGTPEVILIATGSEVQLALQAFDELETQGIKARVVSMPCVEWFEQQDQSYRDEVLPPKITARVSVEAGASLGWYKYLGSHGKAIAIDSFGAPGDSQTLFEHFGITTQAVVNAAKQSLSDAKS